MGELQRLIEAAQNVVLAYAEANPMRTADYHDQNCGCLRCEIDRLEYAVDRAVEAKGGAE